MKFMATDITLSARELDVIRLIVKGKKYREIAVELNLGYETIKTYAARIRKKLNVHSINFWARRIL